MNFFGHAWVAHRSQTACSLPREEFVLGAMLPDFASMLGSRPPRASRPGLQVGLSFHHQTDEAFHGAASFLEFSRQASAYLDTRGLGRGSARAVAHVGVELLLDEVLASDDAANEAYLRAIQHGSSASTAASLHWPTSDGATRFAELCRVLARKGALSSDTPAEQIAERLRRILAGRPRLAMDDAGQSVVREWVLTARPQIAAGAARLISQVEQRLHQTLA
jgi:hypothetical protein